MSAITSEKHETNDIAVIQIHAGESDGAEIVSECNGKHIAVSLSSTQSFRDCHKAQHKYPIEDDLIHILGQAADNVGDEYDDIVNGVLDVIFDAGKPLLAQVAPFPAPSPSNQTLHSLLHLKTFKFRLKTIDGKPAVIPINPNKAFTHFETQSENDIDSDFQIDGDLPQYLTSKIRVLEIFVGSGTVTRVVVNNQEMLCKARATGLLDKNLERELTSLQKVEKAFPSAPSPMYVPKLRGLCQAHCEWAYHRVTARMDSVRYAKWPSRRHSYFDDTQRKEEELGITNPRDGRSAARDRGGLGRWKDW